MRTKTCSTNRRKESAEMRLAAMRRVLRHFDDNFEASIAACSVQLVSVHNISERHTMRNELAYVDLVGGDQVDGFPRGSLIRFDRCSDDCLRAATFVKQNVEVERDGLAARVAEVEDIATLSNEVDRQIDRRYVASGLHDDV